MSGGVDSSVAALLLKEAGYEVIGATMRLYEDKRVENTGRQNGCCSIDDVEDARIVCEILGVPHYVLNVQREFKSYVIDYFLTEYQQGNTPHPCIACNDKIKFSFLMQRAHYHNAKFVATGHHARIRSDEEGLHLLKSRDVSKDQSYVLYNMNRESLSNTLMPVGWYNKDQIREMALEAGFPNANKADSQEICFIQFGDYRQFLKEHINPQPGHLVDQNGTILGDHQGIEFFTVGQRKGLGITHTTPMYVTSIDPTSHDVTLGSEEDLYEKTLWARDVSYISGEPPPNQLDVTVKIRYKSPEIPATLHPKDDLTEIRFKTPQRAITPGQAVVFYIGDEVIGGGRISRPSKTNTTSSQFPNPIFLS